jgi:hypothetical protein
MSLKKMLKALNAKHIIYPYVDHLCISNKKILDNGKKISKTVHR